MNWRDGEEREAYLLGTIGLAKGIHEVFIVPFVQEQVTRERAELVGAFIGGVVLVELINHVK